MSVQTVEPAMSLPAAAVSAVPTEPEPPLSEPAILALESEITKLWGHINAATYRFLTLVAELDRTLSWGYYGCASCAQWLNLKCGIGAGAAREKVRVARALEGLPKISEAFRVGQVSYSKVRAMTRVATPAIEDELLNIACHGTATHVERLCRKFRWVEREWEAHAAETSHQRRYLNVQYCDDETVRIQGRLPKEVGALIRKALDAAMESIEDPEADVPAGTLDAEDRIGAKRADALRHLAEHYLGCESDARVSTAERYQVVVHVDQALLAAAPTSTDDDGHEPGRAVPEPMCCETDDGIPLAVETVRRLGCDASLVGIVEGEDGEPLSIGRKTRAIPAWMRRALKARDGGCRFPGCDRTRFCDGHHVEHWANAGETKLGNLVTLCTFHHRLVHEGGYTVDVTDDGVFVFARPDGRPIAPGNGTEKRSRGNALIEVNRAAGIDRPTLPDGWCGDRMDYGAAVEALFAGKYPDGFAARSAPA
jgi:hypothetical protein